MMSRQALGDREASVARLEQAAMRARLGRLLVCSRQVVTAMVRAPLRSEATQRVAGTAGANGLSGNPGVAQFIVAP